MPICIFVFWSVLLLFTPTACTQPCDIRAAYEHFIQIEIKQHKGKGYLTTSVIPLPEENCAASIVNSYPLLIDYLLAHFSSPTNKEDLINLGDEQVIRQKYVERLQKDSTFTSIMDELVRKTIDKTLPLDTVKIDELVNIAVKFFQITDVQEDRYYTGKICVGINGILQTEERRVPFIEAFAFSVIMSHLTGIEYNVYSEFSSIIREISKVNLGIDQKERVLRAQGATYVLMSRSELLKKALLAEYARGANVLPFILMVE
ncbi:MAG: hypothetical protein ABIM30_08770 [candidate division WOR-3 bacterium]